jgi:hypothetical protein
MLHTYRLVRLIETHSEELANRLVEKVQASPLTQAYEKALGAELRERVHEIYMHLGEWLLGRRDADIERRYTEIGARRFHQGVPLCELIWAIHLTKETMGEFLKDTLLERQEEVAGEMEALELIGHFFDRAMYAATKGYVSALMAEHTRETVKAS